MRREQVAALDTLNSQLAQKELEVRQLPKSPISASLPLILCRQLAESRARLSDTTAAEEASQAGVDTATADVAAERESSALNARRGVANDALRVEADGALQRAEAAKDVRAKARSPQPTGTTNSCVRRSSKRRRTCYSQQRANTRSTRARSRLSPHLLTDPL